MSAKNATGVEEISVEQAAARIGELHVVDVRGADEFDGPLGHIAGAQLLPLDQLESGVDQLPQDRTLLLVCRSGRRSELACAKLAELGLPGAINLKDGMIAWNEASLPLAGGDESRSE